MEYIECKFSKRPNVLLPLLSDPTSHVSLVIMSDFSKLEVIKFLLPKAHLPTLNLVSEYLKTSENLL